ncbi:MAG: helix-turn-helix domain-containing protein [Methylobacter sp.]|uniref:helix-turn-helix domain-containing protein n=1 Tax=Methylobacter sp. TaxID=2051955 RepID=UPI00272FFA4E|nr:helix-turn-helix domain-containing protein [Methylobacter sp.]MDP1664495.1 helix-turn-helix domain-containing protein [Methylobacter sp.]
MSTDATRWAWLQREIKPTAKLVLLSMSDRAGETHECYPSIKRLCEDTNLDRKTVIRSVKALCDCGLMTDTGKRKGLTGQVIVYRLIGVVSRSQADELEDDNDTKSGTVPKPEQFPFSDETVPFFPRKSPKNGTRNLSIT